MAVRFLRSFETREFASLPFDIHFLVKSPLLERFER
jgi:hypothetical protein